MARVYDMQVKEYQKAMKKSSNNNLVGIPQYLKSYQFEEEKDVKKILRSILDESFDFKEEEERHYKLLETTREVVKKGGPLTNSDLKEYPGQARYIQHLENTTDFRYKRKEREFISD